MASRYGSPKMFDKSANVRRRRDDPEVIESILSKEAFDDCDLNNICDLFTVDDSIRISRLVICNAINDLAVDPHDNLLKTWTSSPPFEYHCIAALWDSGWVKRIFNSLILIPEEDLYKACQYTVNRLMKSSYDYY
tara:strand:+ start:759 stop:1163 length:405 start_codon:yes stop_codon:yes gene_type:complete